MLWQANLQCVPRGVVCVKLSTNLESEDGTYSWMANRTPTAPLPMRRRLYDSTDGKCPLSCTRCSDSHISMKKSSSRIRVSRCSVHRTFSKKAAADHIEPTLTRRAALYHFTTHGCKYFYYGSMRRLLSGILTLV